MSGLNTIRLRARVLYWESAHNLLTLRLRLTGATICRSQGHYPAHIAKPDVCGRCFGRFTAEDQQ